MMAGGSGKAKLAKVMRNTHGGRRCWTSCLWRLLGVQVGLLFSGNVHCMKLCRVLPVTVYCGGQLAMRQAVYILSCGRKTERDSRTFSIVCIRMRMRKRSVRHEVREGHMCAANPRRSCRRGDCKAEWHVGAVLGLRISHRNRAGMRKPRSLRCFRCHAAVFQLSPIHSCARREPCGGKRSDDEARYLLQAVHVRHNA